MFRGAQQLPSPPMAGTRAVAARGDEADLLRRYLDEIRRASSLFVGSRRGHARSCHRRSEGRAGTRSTPRPRGCQSLAGVSCATPSPRATPPVAASSSRTFASWCRSHGATNRAASASSIPHPGRQHRPDAGGREVRPSPRLQVLDLRDVVDPPGHRPGDRRHVSHDPGPGARPRHQIVAVSRSAERFSACRARS